MSIAQYAAPCVRAHAMRSRFFSAEDWRLLTEFRRLDDLLAWLRQRDMISSSATTVYEVERELHQINIRSAASILRFVHGSVREALKFFVYYYDLLNVETVIQHLHNMSGETDLSTTLYDTGLLGRVKTEKLARVTNFATLKTLLKGSVFFDSYRKALPRYEQNEDVSRFLNALEVDFMKRWVRAVGACGISDARGWRSSFGAFVSSTGILAALRARFRRNWKQYDVEQWLDLVQGWSPSSDWWMSASEADIAERVFSEALPVPSNGATKTVSDAPNALENRVMSAFWTSVRKRQRQSRFDADFLISFLLQQRIQIDRLIGVIECLDLDLDRETLEDFLKGAA